MACEGGTRPEEDAYMIEKEAVGSNRSLGEPLGEIEMRE
jgi:hypothetical protein